ncbi:MAG: hypothetical protein ACI8UO_001402, partial [Verrucomicrobiales bacterium]
KRKRSETRGNEATPEEGRAFEVHQAEAEESLNKTCANEQTFRWLGKPRFLTKPDLKPVGWPVVSTKLNNLMGIQILDHHLSRADGSDSEFLADAAATDLKFVSAA